MIVQCVSLHSNLRSLWLGCVSTNVMIVGFGDTTNQGGVDKGFTVSGHTATLPSLHYEIKCSVHAVRMAKLSSD
jgi:hypothetical protein